MFIEALFTVAKTCRQPNCPSIEGWIRKMWYIYTMKYYTSIRRVEILPFEATWMHLEDISLSEISQSEKAKNHMISLTYGI